MSKLEWQLLTKKRGSATQGVPLGKEDLAWVTGTVTLIYGEYPNRVNPGSLWAAAKAFKPTAPITNESRSPMLRTV